MIAGGAVLAAILGGGRATRIFTGGALIVIGALVAALAERQFEVWSRGRQVAAAQDATAAAEKERDQARDAAAHLQRQNASLEAGNRELSAAARVCTEQVVELAAEGARRQEEARRRIAAQARALAEDRAAADWLADLLRRRLVQPAAGATLDPCPAGTALQQVRERWQ